MENKIKLNNQYLKKIKTIEDLVHFLIINKELLNINDYLIFLLEDSQFKTYINSFNSIPSLNPYKKIKYSQNKPNNRNNHNKKSYFDKYSKKTDIEFVYLYGITYEDSIFQYLIVILNFILYFIHKINMVNSINSENKENTYNKVKLYKSYINNLFHYLVGSKNNNNFYNGTKIKYFILFINNYRFDPYLIDLVKNSSIGKIIKIDYINKKYKYFLKCKLEDIEITDYNYEYGNFPDFNEEIEDITFTNYKNFNIIMLLYNITDNILKKNLDENNILVVYNSIKNLMEENINFNKISQKVFLNNQIKEKNKNKEIEKLTEIGIIKNINNIYNKFTEGIDYLPYYGIDYKNTENKFSIG